MAQIYLIRHGQASAEADDYDQLSQLGFEQARLLGDWFAQRGECIAHVISGGLRRHQQTADACLAALPPAMQAPRGCQIDFGFDEFDHYEVVRRHRPDLDNAAALRRYLEAQGDTRRAFHHLFSAASERWLSGLHDAEYRETWDAFARRCTAAFHRVVETLERGQIAVVFTSGGTIAAICQHLLGMPNDKAFELNWLMANTGVTRLLQQPGRVTLSYLNSLTHLEQSGVSSHITYR